ncbi:alpha/beta-hydrolase [Hypoxylon sp. NC0597]|nr:alpha/beta-hydrolase [Hypoxylon sp. NC0597]
MVVKVHAIHPQPGFRHTHTMILLHGERHKDGIDCANEFLATKACDPAIRHKTIRELFPTVRWVFPHAPWFHARNGSMVPTTMWLDARTTKDFLPGVTTQAFELTQNIADLQNTIKHEQRIICHDKIFLGGFGQGFATAYAAYFLDNQRFAGMIGLGAWVPFHAITMTRWQKTELAIMLWQQQQLTPVFLSHSRDDNVVPVEEGRMVESILRHLTRAKVEYHEYEHGGSWINTPEGVNDLVAFLARQLDPLPLSTCLTSSFGRLRL